MAVETLIDNAMAEEAGKRPSISEEKRSISGDVEVAETVTVHASQAIDPVAERKLVWQFDIRILPIIAAMYLFNNLDRGNMGNAETDGLSKTLGLVGDQYSILVSVRMQPI